MSEIARQRARDLIAVFNQQCRHALQPLDAGLGGGEAVAQIGGALQPDECVEVVLEDIRVVHPSTPIGCVNLRREPSWRRPGERQAETNRIRALLEATRAIPLVTECKFLSQGAFLRKASRDAATTNRWNSPSLCRQTDFFKVRSLLGGMP
jgi:hypothetical protein